MIFKEASKIICIFSKIQSNQCDKTLVMQTDAAGNPYVITSAFVRELCRDSLFIRSVEDIVNSSHSADTCEHDVSTKIKATNKGVNEMNEEVKKGKI